MRPSDAHGDLFTTKDFKDNGWRKSRLTAAYILAEINAVNSPDTKAFRDIFDLCVGLHDHEGCLIVYWNVPLKLVPQAYKDCFEWAWSALNEEIVEHEYEEQQIF